MPNAHTHDWITLASAAGLTPLVFGAGLAHGLMPDAAAAHTGICVGAHLVSGIWFSPDLDMDSSIDDRWGPLGWIWRPYAAVVPHRSWWSHGLIVPPLLRLLYVYLVALLVWGGLGWVLSTIGVVAWGTASALNDAIMSVARRYPTQTLMVMVGFVTGGAAHSITDWTVTRVKRWGRRRRF